MERTASISVWIFFVDPRRCTMQITARTGGNSTILDLNGRLVLGGSLTELRNAVRDATGKHPEKLILNLGNVTYIDSCGIGELVTALKHVRSRGGRLVLTNLPRRVKILLDTAQLMKVFEVTDGERLSVINSKQQIPQQLCC
jgi:anti-sigma B factor antagonist